MNEDDVRKSVAEVEDKIQSGQVVKGDVNSSSDMLSH